MADFRLNADLEDIDKAMIALRNSMSGLPIRWAGFKSEHDALARAAASLTTMLLDAEPVFKKN